jgi:hypothetical protein
LKWCNIIWIDNVTFKPIRTGIKYYIKVVNDLGSFSDIFKDAEKEWDIQNGKFIITAGKKAATFFAGSDSWDNYTIEYKIKDVYAVGA